MMGALIRRFVVYRLLHYRVAWLVFGLLTCYLTVVAVAVVGARAQATAVGVPRCAGPRDGNMPFTLTLAGGAGATFHVNPANFEPDLAAVVCSAPRVAVTYETDAWTQHGAVDEVQAYDAWGDEQRWTDLTRGDFAQTTRVEQIAVGVAMGALSLAMLGVALFWGYASKALARKRPVPRRGRGRRTAGVGAPRAMSSPSDVASTSGGIRWPRRQGAGRPAGACRRSGSARGMPVPEAFAARAAEEMRWLATLPWGTAAAGADPTEEARRFAEGMRLVRGWAGDDERLVRGVELLVGCRPALAWTGAAEAALQFGAYDLNVYAPAALAYAEGAVGRALAREPDCAEARACELALLAARAQAGDAGALAQAERRLRELRALRIEHPGVPLASGLVHVAAGRPGAAILPLRTAVAAAPSLEEADAVRLTLAQALARARRRDEADALLGELRARGMATGAEPLPPARCRRVEVGAFVVK